MLRILCCLFLLLPTSICAQNLLGNPDFTSGITVWSNPPQSGTSTPNAGVGSPVAGSVELNVSDPSGNGITQALQQCVPVTANGIYAATGRNRMGSVTSGGANPFLIIQFYSNTTCTSSDLSSHISSQGISYAGVPGSFEEHGTGRVTAPPTAIRAKVTIQVQTGGPGSVQGWWDHVFFGIDPIFANGFQ